MDEVAYMMGHIRCECAPPCHPEGGLPSVERDAALGPVVDTYAGPV